MKTKKSKGILIALSLLASWVITIASGVLLPIKEREIYGKVVRLHIIANSDTELDQTVKLMVRDAVLEEATEIFSGKTIAEAKEISASSLEKAETIAETVLESNGFDYGAKAIFGVEDYPTREYDGITLPAGSYYSLRIVLGEGDGKNWWCVLFPPLCLGSSAVITQITGDTDVKTEHTTGIKYKIRFKFLEWFG